MFDLYNDYMPGTEPDDIQKLKDEIIPLMEQCSHALYHRDGRKHGQLRILMILEHESPITQRELQDKLKIRAGSMSEIITKLENSGFVEKSKDENDKRRAVIVITNKGREALRDNLAATIQSGREMLDPLSTEELYELLRILRKLRDAWDSEFFERPAHGAKE